MAEMFFKNFISRFTRNSFSKETTFKFGYWLSKNRDDAEVDAALQELWDETPGKITDQTLEDFAKLQLKIERKASSKKRIRLTQLPIFRYAAVILLLLTTSIITYVVTQPKDILYTECTVLQGEHKTLTLPDGSEVVINAGSTFLYPKEFTTNTRSVFLSGEAIFKVAKNPHKPFIVNTNHISVQALGTEFNIKAYPSFGHTTATLIEGKVRIRDHYSEDKIDLIPNQQYVFNNTDHKKEVKKVDASKVGLWEQGYLIFQDVAFSEIITTVERNYNVKVLYDQSLYEQYHCNVKFNPDETINDIISVLCAMTSKASYEINNNQVIIHEE